jgi:hypothetical protein
MGKWRSRVQFIEAEDISFLGFCLFARGVVGYGHT